MIKLLATATLTLGLLASGGALAAETLTHNGVTYEYSVVQKGTTRVISGYDVTNDRPFTLRVAHGRVEGTVAGSAVTFQLREVKPIAKPVAEAEVAAR